MPFMHFTLFNSQKEKVKIAKQERGVGFLYACINCFSLENFHINEPFVMKIFLDTLSSQDFLLLKFPFLRIKMTEIDS